MQLNLIAQKHMMITQKSQISQIFKKSALSVALFLLLISPFNTVRAYVSPDWNAINAANARQQVGAKQGYYSLSKEKKNNKKQQIKKKKSLFYKYDKKAEKKLNKKQKISKNLYYTYDRKAEIARNNLQKVK